MSALTVPIRGRAANWFTAVSAGAACVAILLQPVAYRRGEAQVEAQLLQSIARFPATAGGAGVTIWTGLGTDRVAAFDVTPLCSTEPYAAALLAVTTVLLMGHWSRLSNVLFGLIGALATMIVTNLLRLAVVILATRRWGTSGFAWSHAYLGTMISVTGLFAAACIFIVSLLHGRIPAGTPQDVDV